MVPVALASPGNLLGQQILGTHPRAESETLQVLQVMLIAVRKKHCISAFSFYKFEAEEKDQSPNHDVTVERLRKE